MKKLVIIACLLVFGLTQAQEEKPMYEVSGNLVKVTYFHKNGKVKQRGYFKNKKLEGTWKSFDEQGKKTAIAYYKDGKKVGKWLLWGKAGVQQIDYDVNKISSVKSPKTDTKVAIK